MGCIYYQDELGFCCKNGIDWNNFDLNKKCNYNNESECPDKIFIKDVENMKRKLEQLKELSDKWIKVQPSPYNDAFSDPPQSISFLHACGNAVREILGV